MMPEKRLVAIWCEDCQQAKTPSGSAWWGDTPSRCGVDYGDGFVSHLNVSPLYVDVVREAVEA